MTSNADSNGSTGAIHDEKNNSHGKHGDDEDRKLFVGGLSWDTNEDDIRSYFNKFGTVLDVSVKYDAVSGQPRGFGFLTFAEDHAIDKVIAASPHTIKNKVIDPKRAKSRPICKKVFVGGIDANVTEEEIRNYFSRFGKVEGIELPYDRQKGRRREFCFIIFDTEENADSACKDAKQKIGNRECDVKKAQPQPVAQQQKRLQQAAQSNSGVHSNSNGLFDYSGFGYGDSKKRSSSSSGGGILNTGGTGVTGAYNGAFGPYYGAAGQQQQYYNNYGYYNTYEQYYNQQQQQQQTQQPQQTQQQQPTQYGFNYGDYWNYAYGAYSGSNNQATDYPTAVVANEQNYMISGPAGTGAGGNASGHSSQSSSHSAHHTSGKVRKTAPNTYHHPYRNTSSH